MEIDARMIITIAGMAASVITSFIVVRQKVSELEQNLKDAVQKLSKLDSRLDRNDNATDLVSQRMNVISGMMSPEAREKLHRSLERMDISISGLQDDVNSLKKMHNGKHPKLDL
jgi:predicted RNase H-like nuclease (RuvC/YqgF family)|tara:strand:+ start:1598 stop:1939 length:342 start_codon:yes stop_codon:yes gene_type:complete